MLQKINVKDSRGRGINDPFFDRETINFSEFTRLVDEYVPPFATGGRVGFKDPAGRVGGGMRKKVEDYLTVETGGNEIQWVLDENGNLVPWVDPNPVDEINTINVGSGIKLLLKADGGRVGFKYGSRTIAKGALAFLKKNKKNSEYMFKASDNVSPGYAHGDTKYNAELLAEQLAEDAGVVYDDLDHIARSEFYGTAYEYLSNEMAQVLLQKRMLKDIGQKMQLSEFDITGRKPNASGGLAKILEV